MAKKTHTIDFKVMIVELLKSGRSLKELSSEYGLGSSMMGRWRREYNQKSGDMSKKKELGPQEQEVRSLRRELKEVRLERDILKKAVSIFSKGDR